jgi:hypothetical protein
MTSKVQLNKNIALSGELADFLSKSVSILKNNNNSSYVVFSETDKDLNKLNEKLAKDLAKEGNKVIKATKSKNSKKNWIFEPYIFG